MGLSLRPSKKFGHQKCQGYIFNRHCSTAKIYFCYSFSITSKFAYQLTKRLQKSAS